MYECDCKEGYLLREDGYSCYEELKLNSFEDILYQNDAVISAVEVSLNNTESNEIPQRESNDIPNYVSNFTTTAPSTNYTTQGPRLEQKATSDGTGVPKVTMPISLSKQQKLCLLDCGPGGGCSLDEAEDEPVCLCPLGRGGQRCEEGKIKLHTMRSARPTMFLYAKLKRYRS
ncbi:unnamed protein product [Acanthoscelides obtectus]|uniref:EGF-like domain-containing protein n=1 Tax=Acanthoscelides obtectus TaxID=200917 RepID=A0A9P0LIE3_ACAOB|nr:unnamed protein product [Acanthoscelides obtectus]CAK1634388.1 hypothetical protein AOBTE_LOCUS8741 [Acanthoscelides obtectus]